MNADRLKSTLNLVSPPSGLSLPGQALWHLAHGDRKRAHAVVQEDESPEAAWVHAHLHRVEGDAANAAYWYGRAGRPVSLAALDEEWNILADALAYLP